MVLIKLRAEGMVFVEGAIDFSHTPSGSNVLYMDGHVEFIRYPGEWPLTRAYAGG